MTTTNATTCVDRDDVLSSFRRWEAEQAELDSQLAESVAALAAYQSHLDGWQQQLAQERNELRQLRATLERNQALVGAEHAHWEHTNRELNEARDKIMSLTASLLSRTEELRDLDQQHGGVNTELAAARAREQELAAALAAQQQSFATERYQLERELAGLRQQVERGQQPEQAASPAPTPTLTRSELQKSLPPKSESPRTSSPVLGSVMEQFGKLRQQRSANRNNPKPR